MCQLSKKLPKALIEDKAECDSFAKDIKKIDTDENLESDQTLEQQRKELSEKLIFS